MLMKLHTFPIQSHRRFSLHFRKILGKKEVEEVEISIENSEFLSVCRTIRVNAVYGLIVDQMEIIHFEW